MKKLTFILLFLSISISIYSQDLSSNLLKYWKYRERLKYFVVPGIKQGESEMAGFRNKIPDNNSLNLDYGQHGVYFGYYLGVLATEYYLLLQNNQQSDAQNTDYELQLALHQFNNYMDKNGYWGSYNNENTNLNGFFVRENMPCDFLSENSNDGVTSDGQYHIDLLNKGLDPILNKWDDVNLDFGNPRGHPGYSDFTAARLCANPPNLCNNGVASITKEPMSTDEVIGVLLGLALIEKLGSESAKSMAEEIACRTIQYCQFNHGILWEIRLPDANTIHSDNCNGVATGNTGGYCYPFVKTSRYFDNDCITWDFMSASSTNMYLWQLQSTFANPVVWNNSMSAVLAAIGNSWVIGLNVNIGVCPICIHFTISINNTPTGIKTVTDNHNNETFYLALWEVLQSKSTDKLSMTKAFEQLNSAPCEGPYKYSDDIFAGGGWASSYRWRDDLNEQYGLDATSAKANFNGLDYMLMYNLYHILNSENMPYYTNYVDRTFAGYTPSMFNFNGIDFISGTNQFPLTLIALNTIISTQTIGLQTQPEISNDPGNVTYIAGTSIHLKPGFHVVEGAYFHAYLDDLNCNVEELGGKSMSTNLFDLMYTPELDSLISVPKSPYPLKSEDSIPIICTIPCPNDTLYFNGIDFDTTGNLFNYYWDFGNGITSSENNPKVYYEPGTYNFKLVLSDSNTVLDTIRIIINVIDCDSTVRGILTENPDCGSLPVPYDSLWLVDANDSIVAGVTPVITDSLGRFWFLQNEVEALDSNALFAFRSGNGYVLQDTAHHTIQQWLDVSPLQFTLADILKKEWKKVYSSSADSANVYAKAVDIYDNIYVLGRLNSDSTGNDYLTLKYNPSGNLAWAQTYNSPYNNSDKAEAITTDLQCNIIVTGSSKDANATQDYLTIKYDSAGSWLWAQRYDVSNGSSDAATCLKTDINGNVFVSGLSVNQSSQLNLVTLKYNSSGQLQWSRSFNAGSYSQSLTTQRVGMAVDSLGYIYLSGSCRDSLGDIEYVALKYDNSGTLLWQAKRNISSQQADIAAAIAVDHAGSVFVSGTTGTVKFSTNGSYQWEQGGNYNRMALDASGNVYVGNALPYSLIKFDNSSGSVLWSDYSKQVNDLAVDKNDDVYVISNNEISKFSSTGDFITSKLFAFTGVSLEVSENLNVYVAGNLSQSQGGTGLADIATAKYSQCPSVASLRSASTRPPDNTAPIVSQTEKPVKIVPNPNNGNMELLSENNFEPGSKFSIYDLTGRVLYKMTITEETTRVQVNTSELQNGIYLYSVISPHGKLLVKDKLVIMK